MSMISAPHVDDGSLFPHPLLSCTTSNPWTQFKKIVEEATPPGHPVCAQPADPSRSEQALGGERRWRKAIAVAFVQAFRMSRIFYRQASELFRNQGSFLVLCEKFEVLMVGSADWAQGVPIPEFEQHVSAMTFVPGIDAHMLPCFFGWLTAVLCELRVVFDVARGAWHNFHQAARATAAGRNSDSVRGEAYHPEVLEKPLLEEWHAVISALAGGGEVGKHSDFRRLLSSLIQGGHRALVLLESSGWPARLLDVVHLAGLGGIADKPSLGIARSFAMRVLRLPLGLRSAPSNHEDKQSTGTVRIWAVSLHATLISEPVSVLAELSARDGFKLRTDMLLLRYYCDLQDHLDLQCAQAGPLRDLIARSVDDSVLTMDRAGRFPLLREASIFTSEFVTVARGVPEIKASDLLMCGEPAILCGALWAVQTKPVIGYLGNSLGAYLSQEDQRVFFTTVSMATRPVGPRQEDGVSLSFVWVCPHLAAQAYWQVGIEFPVVRPLGRYTGATYRMETRDVLITRQVFTFWDFQCLLNRALGDVGWRFTYITHLQNTSWAHWARHRAAVVLPYEVSQLVVYELYGMGMPLLVPSVRLLPLFFARSYGHARELANRRPGWQGPPCDANNTVTCGAAWGDWHFGARSFAELNWWASLSDLSSLEYTFTWASLAELLAVLVPEHDQLLQSASEAALAYCKRALDDAVDFWREGLRGMLPSVS